MIPYRGLYSIILLGDLSYLVGTWDWDSTFHEYNWCTGFETIEETIYPEENNFSVTFEKEGYVSFFVNDSLIRMEGLTLKSFQENEGDERHTVFCIGEAQSDTDLIAVVGVLNKSRILRFPFQSNDGGCEIFQNYF